MQVRQQQCVCIVELASLDDIIDGQNIEVRRTSNVRTPLSLCCARQLSVPPHCAIAMLPLWRLLFFAYGLLSKIAQPMLRCLQHALLALALVAGTILRLTCIGGTSSKATHGFVTSTTRTKSGSSDMAAPGMHPQSIVAPRKMQSSGVVSAGEEEMGEARCGDCDVVVVEAAMVRVDEALALPVASSSVAPLSVRGNETRSTTAVRPEETFPDSTKKVNIIFILM